LEAERTQSVNTIYLDNNQVVGHNTDISGFELGIKNLKFEVTGKKIFILGAGGVTPSIIFALNKMKVSEITISNRTKNRADSLKVFFKDLKIVDWGDIPEFDMIINATSVGLNNDDKINLDFSKVGKGKFFYDVIYNPKETNFLKIGKKMGNETENGKLMFIYQAFTAFKVWHGIEPEINNEIIQLLD
jgi:shikimate dehydrogenase